MRNKGTARLVVGLAALAIATTVGRSMDRGEELPPLRVGYTDHMIVLGAMAEYQSAQRQLAEQNAADQAAIRKLYEELQERAKRYELQRALLSAEGKAQREDELARDQREIERKSTEMSARLSERRTELLGPLYERVDRAIKAVSREQGLDLVLRIQLTPNEPSILYANEDRVVDITDKVAEELGIPRDGGASGGN